MSRAIAKHVIAYADGKSTIHSLYTPSFLYNREMMGEMGNKRFSLNKSALTDFWNIFNTKLSGFSYDSEEKYPFKSDDFYIFEELTHTGDLSENTDPGEFECEIYEYTLDPIFIENYYQNISFSASINQKEYREFVNRFHGIKVVRDGFVVQGLGEGDGGDWLGLASSSKTKGRYNDLRNDSVIGCVYLTGKNNYVLKETTNREGFVEDGFYLSFRKILSESIKRINKNRDRFNSSMRSYLRGSISTTADTNKNALVFQPVIDEIKGKLEESQSGVAEKSQAIADTLSNFVSIKSDLSNNPFVSKETVATFENTYSNIQKLADNYRQMDEAQQYLAKMIDEISFEYEKLTDKLRDLFELAGLGLSVEMFAHEFDSSIRNIRSNNDKLLTSDSHSIEALVRQIHYVNVSLDTLRKQMSYFNPGLKFVRSKKQTISFLKFIQDHQSFYSERCKAKKTEYIIDIKSDFEITVNRGMINQVFDNLFNNSEYWLNFSEEHDLIDIKTFTVQSVEKGIVIVFDNGIGVSEDIENRLFEPFETKKENGRGLGLYIVANNLMYHSARVRLLGERNSHGKLFKFELDLSAIMAD
ncbi:MAG: HAMP domain-containing histidine kinase [Ruminococcaceae bacterium]|nr:HAMP domain-containing histidine kinase [Oscillospiraceae bacterium]